MGPPHSSDRSICAITLRSSVSSHRCSRRSLSDFWASPWARRLGSAALLERLRGEGLAIAGPAETLPRSRSSRLSARSEEHTSELQALMRISYAVFCLKKKKNISATETASHRNIRTKHTD